MTYGNLKTNSLINWVKFILILPIILICSLLFKFFSFYGFEIIITIIPLSVIAWFYRIKFAGDFVVGGSILNVSVKKNMFGYSTIVIKHSKLGLLKKRKTKNKLIDFEDKVNHLLVKIKVNGDDGRTPICSVKEMK